MRITVAICTWNRARLLDQTLDGFRKLLIPPATNWELLIVNNNCTDETDAVIARHNGSLPIRRLFEPEPGLSMARNHAVVEANSDLIVWTDDDVIVDEGWLAAYARAAADWPKASFFGGPISPLFEVEPPRWITRNLDHLADAYAVLQLAGGTRPLEPEEYVFGANMATRKSALPEPAFDSRFGSRCIQKTGSDETELQARLRLADHQGVWIDQARVRHFIPVDRLSGRYLQECYRGRGRSLARREGPTSCPLLLGYPRYAVRRYLKARVSLVLCWPGGRRWARAFSTSASLEGFLAESIQQRSASRNTAP